MNGENVMGRLRRELEASLPQDLVGCLDETDGGLRLAQELLERFSPSDVAERPAGETYRTWEASGLYILHSGKPTDARAIFWGLYDHLLRYEEEHSTRTSLKATPLIWIAHCHLQYGHAAHAQRYLMLALCEDAINSGGRVRLRSTGVLERLRNYGLTTDDVVQHYAQMANALYASNPREGHYPEWILAKIQEQDDKWMTAVPVPAEGYVYLPNLRYLRHLMKGLGTGAGQPLESLATYILSVMPGCRTARRRRTWATELDIVCSVDGIEADFRSELGRYFVCECKDRKGSVTFTDIAKFCRVLEGVKSRFGVMFSPKGVSGQRKRLFGELALMNLFQESGIVVVVIDQHDLDAVSCGESFISRLRAKYEATRLALQPAKKSGAETAPRAAGGYDGGRWLKTCQPNIASESSRSWDGNRSSFSCQGGILPSAVPLRPETLYPRSGGTPR